MQFVGKFMKSNKVTAFALAIVAGLMSALTASAQYVFTNGVPDPTAVITTANTAWTNVATLIVSILALSIIVSIVYKIRRR